MKSTLLKYKVAVIFLYLLTTTTISAKDVERQNLGEAPLSFVENKGQITNQHGTLRNDIQFKLQSGELALFIGDGQLHYQWSKLLNPEAAQHEPNPWNKPAALDDGNYQDPKLRMQAYRMDVQLVGANTNATIIKEEQQSYFEQYYMGHANGQAHSYNKITYKNIYPHIDWVLYTNEQQLKYDFIIHPGGDVNDIQLQYKGATALNIKDGALTATTPMGSITEAAPVSFYEDGSSVSSTYKLEGNVLSFDIPNLNKSNTLIIDPSLEWATYYGSTAADYSYALVADSAGNVYMAGSTLNSSNIATTGAHQTTYGGNKDAMVIKFTEAGIRLWSTYYGGTGDDDFFSATTDGSHNIYLAGLTGSTTGIATSGAHQTSFSGGNSDCFLVKMSPNGVRLWSTYFGGSGNEKSNIEYQVFVGCDSSDNIFMVGNTRSTTGIATSGAHQTSNGGNIDGFLVKFNTSGTRQWGTYLGGGDNDNMRKLAFDGSGNVYVAGEMRSGGKATSGAHQTAIGGNNDAYLIKFNSSGVAQWATYYGGSGSDSPQGLSVDYSGSYIFMSGSTNSSSGIVTSGAHSTALNGSGSGTTSDAFLVKMTTSGSRVWGTYYGGSGVDHSGDLIIDGAGNPGFTGTTSSTTGIATTGSHQQNNGGNNNFDAMFVIFTQNGSLSWASYYGGGSQDYGYGINNAAQNIIYITGFSSSINNIAFSGHQNTMAGASDAFLAKFTPDTTSFIFQPFTDTVHCVEDTFTVQYGVTAKFYNNNTFSVQLSDASGSFASPVTIGSRADTIGGNILCTIPTGSTPGSNYRIRIVATSPVDTSFDNGNSIDIKPKPVKPVATSNSPACDNDTLKLYASTTTPGVTYIWNGPFSFTSLAQNPIRTYLVTAYSGDYMVTANLNGCSRKDTVAVTILHAPDKPTTTVNNPVCSGDSIKLGVTTNTTGVTYSWTGPNNFSSTSANPVITNVTSADSGDYIASVIKNGCPSKDTITVNVIPTLTINPTLSISPGSTVCPTTDVSFSAANVPNGSTYLWTGPNNYLSSASMPNKYNCQKIDSGYYKVIITANACSSVEDSIFLSVTDTIQSPNLTTNTPVCEGDTLEVEVSSIYSSAYYEITEPNGTKNTGVKKITFLNVNNTHDGRYVAKLVVNGCTAFDTTYVTIKPTPATPTASNNGPFCESKSLQLMGNGSGTGITYDWEGPLNYNSTQQNPTINNITTANSGVYTLRTVLNGCYSKPATTTVLVDTLPRPQISGNSPLCEQQELSFTLTGGLTGATYSWTGPGGFSSNAMEPKRSNAQPGFSGDYIVTVTTPEGCEGKDTATIEVVALPETPLATANTPICQEDGLILREQNNNATDVTYSWTGPNNYTAIGKNISVNPVQLNQAGRYEVTVSRKGCTRSAAVDVVVKPKPNTPVATSNSPVTLGKTLLLDVSNIQNGVSYSWEGPNSFNALSAKATIPNVISASEGTYTVTATLNGCIASGIVYVTITPIKASDEEFILYPNPNNGTFNIRAELTYDQTIPIEIVNSIGMVVYRDEVTSVNKQIEHEVSVEGHLASGVYLFRTYVKGRYRTVPFTISR